MNIQPLQDRVVIKRLEEERTKGGIVIPDTANTEKPSRGEILAIGKGKIGDDGKIRPVTVKTGDTVLFGKYSGTEVKVNGEDVIIMREDDILAVLQ